MGLLYCTLGLAGEAGEVAEKIKKVLRDSGGVVTPRALNKIILEGGDLLWYISQQMTELGVLLETVPQRNIRKVMSRKRRGKIHGNGDNR